MIEEVDEIYLQPKSETGVYLTALRNEDRQTDGHSKPPIEEPQLLEVELRHRYGRDSTVLNASLYTLLSLAYESQ